MWSESIVKYELKLPVENPAVTRSFIAFLTRLCDESEEKERLDAIEQEERRKTRLSSRRVQKKKVTIKSESDNESENNNDDADPEPPLTPDSKIEDKLTCECGTIVKKSGLTRHKKSDKHKNYAIMNLKGIK